MSVLNIRGYTDQMSVAAGEKVTVHVSTDTPGTYTSQLIRLFNGDLHPDGPGPREVPVDCDANGEYPARWQRTQIGGHIIVDDKAGALVGTGSFTVHAFVSSMLPTRDLPQGLVSRWNEATKAGWMLSVDPTGKATFTVGDGSGRIAAAVSDRTLFPDVFYALTACYDATAGTVTLFQTSVVNSCNSRFGKVFPLDSTTTVSSPAPFEPSDSGTPVVIAGVAENSPDATGRTWVTHVFNGKIDSPTVFAGVVDQADADQLASGTTPAGLTPVAQWSFSAGYAKTGIADDIIHDISGHGLNGHTVNTPDRGMTGWNWNGIEDVYKYAPEEYGAIWFHEDSIDDSRWDADFEATIPAELASGCYAFKITQGQDVDWVPFFVRAPRDHPTSKIALLIPTMSYLAYANTQVMQSAQSGQPVMGHFGTLEAVDLEIHEHTTLEPRDMELHEGSFYGLSTYDYHLDGRGCQYSSWRRPIMNMRPRYTHEFGAVWQFPADLQLVGWLDEMGFEVDIITDHDLIKEGVDLMRRYNVVMTGSHPEYYTRGMCEAWEDYLAGGGRGMYMGGNGWYWIVAEHPQRPWLIEVRKGEQGDQAWRARPGELWMGHNGERSGLWRMRGRSSAKTWGTVYTSHCLDVGFGYSQLPDARDPKLAWMFDNIGPDEVIGDFGLVNRGAAGLEVDRYDQMAGTPPNAYLVASAYSTSKNWVLVPEDQYFAHSGMNAPEHPQVHADIVYFSTANGGAQWTTASMSWCGSLLSNQCQNNVSQITANVLRHFAQDGPLPEI
ncbi:MAG: hypothetical protein FWF43_05105 [Propionibacteriaceae bacterium]|nr:hypothetical protein [Propionibacteriaceae bacterium]